jgi:hypothetical protein
MPEDTSHNDNAPPDACLSCSPAYDMEMRLGSPTMACLNDTVSAAAWPTRDIDPLRV